MREMGVEEKKFKGGNFLVESRVWGAPCIE
jgi:hypothetical protein